MSHFSSQVTIRSGAQGNSRLSRARELIKLLARSITQPHASHGWLGLLNSDPIFSDLVAARPRLVGKVFRPYLSNTFDSGQRTSLLIGHYHSVLREGWGPLVVQAARTGVELGSIRGKSGHTLSIVLRAIEPMDREGELTLQLMHDDVHVYCCAFSLIQSANGIYLGIGCLQGPRGDTSLDIVREATRQLHGLRPKNLLLKVISAIGHQYGCAGMRLVGNRNRAVRRALKDGKVHADYDAFWLECGAQRRADGDYDMPCAPLAPPDFASIASSKRSVARQRYELLRQFTSSISATLQHARQYA
ncbi:DUF535 family protein [Duganella sp. 3397]|uniref:DUF535 family protein n=1 Tax=Duganella sp. 3397 TaxID=2817732 RepID=UPI00286A6DFC|nr:DUF535 family protein [Duganella sp. 3397]